MIVPNIDVVHHHLAVNQSFEYKDIQPDLRAAERDFLKPVIGLEQIAVFTAEIDTEDSLLTQAKLLVEELLCNYAYYLYIPLGSVQINGGGIFIEESGDRRSAGNAEKNDLQRSFKRRAHRCLDELLEFMEESPTKFTEFFNSKQYKKYASLLVNKTSVFNDIYNIENSGQTFFRLRPSIKKAEDQYLKNTVQKELLGVLKTAQSYQLRIEVKDLLERALVYFTVANILGNGSFKFSGDSLLMRFDILSFEKINTAKNEGIHTSKTDAMADANNYLTQALTLIKNNLTDFPEYIPPNQAKTQQKLITKHGGMVSI